MHSNHFYNKQLNEKARELRLNPTKAERRLWYELLCSASFGGYKFLRQRPIDKFIVDFYCKELKLVIEVDGYTHEYDETIIEDEQRDVRLGLLGIHVIRFSDFEVLNNLGEVQRLLWAAMQSLGAQVKEGYE